MHENPEKFKAMMKEQEADQKSAAGEESKAGDEQPEGVEGEADETASKMDQPVE